MSDSPRLYVGTYAKYNSGSLRGAWLDLDDYADREDFLRACAELHKDEADPELMFQDFENFPREWYCESSAPPDELWTWIDLSDADKALLAAWVELGTSSEPTIEEAREASYGVYDSEEDFAQDYAEETGAINANAQWPYSYINWEAATRELMMDFDSVEHEGKTYIFRS